MKLSKFKGFKKKKLLDDFGVKVKNVMHENLSAPTTLQRDLMKFGS